MEEPIPDRVTALTMEQQVFTAFWKTKISESEEFLITLSIFAWTNFAISN